MTEEKMSLLMKKGYLEPLRQQFPYSQVIPVFNQADTMKLEENGKNILERMEVRYGKFAENMESGQLVSYETG